MQAELKKGILMIDAETPEEAMLLEEWNQNVTQLTVVRDRVGVETVMYDLMPTDEIK